MAVFSMRLPGCVITVSPQACPASARDLLKYMHAAVRDLAFCDVGGCPVWAGAELGRAGLVFRMHGHKDYDGRCGEVAMAELADASSKAEFAWKCRASWQCLVLPTDCAASVHSLWFLCSSFGSAPVQLPR